MKTLGIAAISLSLLTAPLGGVDIANSDKVNVESSSEGWYVPVPEGYLGTSSEVPTKQIGSEMTLAGTIAATASPEEISTQPAGVIPNNPYNCWIQVDSPHHGKNPDRNTIRVHSYFKNCNTATSGKIEVSLWRSRWWGYQEINKSGIVNSKAPSNGGKSHPMTMAEWAPGDACHYYRGNTYGQMLIGSNVYQASDERYDQRKINGKPEGCGVNIGA